LAGASTSTVGVAVRDPLEPGVADVAAAVSDAAGLTTPPRIVTRGCAVALGESWCGAAKGARHVVALTAADSVHSGLVVNGVPFEGAHALAGAAAWLALNPVEREDYRRVGSLQAEIGAAGIVRRLVWRIKSGDPSRVLDMAGGDMGAIQVHQIFDAARNGDGVSISVVRDTARYVGMAVANLVAIVDPDIVVLGGLIADAADQLLQPSLVEAVRRLPKSIGDALVVAAALLGDDGGPLGAARAAMIAP
jgi:glucokinase